MDNLPPPPVPADCDLRAFQYLPLDVVRLRDSELVAVASAEEFRAAVLLWCAAWHQLPASSLPKEDRALAHLAGYGRDLKGWAKVRAGALRGWEEASDGRLYHRVVTEKAAEAWRARQDQRARTEAARQARAARRNGGAQQTTEVATSSAASSVTESVTISKGEGREREGKGRDYDAADAASSPERAAPPAADMFDGIQEHPPLRVAQRPRNLGDFQALHPRIYVGRDERGAWEALLVEYEWDLMDHAYRALEPTVPRGMRVLLSMITGWLGENTKLKDAP